MKKITIVVSTIFILLSFSYFFFKKQKNKFEYVSPKIGEVVEAIYGLGTVKSDQSFEVKIGVITTLKKVFVKEGDFIKEGDPLVQFEGLNTFKAPFSGTITNLNYQQGETVLPQITVLKMENLKDLYIEVSLEQDGALRVREGQKASVVFESIRNEKQLGSVRSIYPKNEEFLARIEVEKLKNNILTGMTADVAIEVGRMNNVLLIPISSIENGKVLLIRDGKRLKEEVRIGKTDGAWAEVLSENLSVNDQVLIRR